MNAEAVAAEKPKKIRAFLALKTPPEWDAAFSELQQTLKSSLRSHAFKWVKPEQMHITLRFLGYILPNDADAMKALLPGICAAHRKFTLRCDGLGCFPNARRPRVLWAGLAGDLPHIEALHTAVIEKTRHIGEPPEDRPFKPHLTLARIQNLERSAVDRLEHAIKTGFSIGSDWTVNELILMQSHLSPHGANYSPIARCPLL